MNVWNARITNNNEAYAIITYAVIITRDNNVIDNASVIAPQNRTITIFYWSVVGQSSANVCVPKTQIIEYNNIIILWLSLYLK